MAPDEQRQLLSQTFLSGLEFHDEIASTNDRALELCAADKQPTPWLVMAQRQTSGRGRGANRWWSGHGALLCSLIVNANQFHLAEAAWPRVSLCAGAAMCEVLARHLAGWPHVTVGLKWPNDVWLSGRKVCGILVEVSPQRRGHLVVGVGLNVNNSLATAPSELQAIATSLRDASGTEHDVPTLLSDWLQQLEADLTDLANSGSALAARSRARCVLTDRSVSLDTGTQLVTGRCLGIADDGALRLQLAAGEQQFYGGVIRGISPPP